MKKLPTVYVVSKDAAGVVQPIPPEGLVLDNFGEGGGCLRTDAEGRALELPTALRDYAAREQKRLRRAGLKNVRTTVVLRHAGVLA